VQRQQPETISRQRIAAVLGADWGFCHTTERNLGKLAELWAETPVVAAACDVEAQIESLRQTIDEAPKTRGWRMRSRIGERVRWYETPEEVGH
jgi:PII-like signaling protein